MSLRDGTSGRDWRAALAALDPASARAEVSLHAAQLLLARGLNGEAEAALREFLKPYPDHLQGLQALAMLLRQLGRHGEAAEFLARAARAESEQFDVAPGDRRAVEQFLAAADVGESSPAAAPPAFVTAVFDEGAERFDALLRGNLQYRAPEVLLEAVSELAGRPLRDLDILDLGCGTGLAGELFRPTARRLDGVDLSSKMIEQAAAKGMYDRLFVGEVVAHLNGIDDRFHLIIAADVFVYLGDLVPVLTAARRVLRPGGWIAFTVEAAETADYMLQTVRRYAHSRDYLIRAAGEAGLGVGLLTETSTRIESFRPVWSFVCVLADPQEADGTATGGDVLPSDGAESS